MSCTTVHPSLTRLQAEHKSQSEKIQHLEKENAVLRQRIDELTERAADANVRCLAAETAYKQSEEQMSVAGAERKLVDELLGRADATVAELRTERATLLKRNGELHADCSRRQQLQLCGEQERARLETALGVAQMELKLTNEKADRMGLQLEEGAARASELEAKVAALDKSLEAVRQEKAALQESLAVAQAERKLLDETTMRSSAHSSADVQSLRERLQLAEGRCDAAHEAKSRADEERAALQTRLTVAQAEKRILQDVTAKLQQAQIDERQASRQAAERADAERSELLARLEMAETSSRHACERLASLEADQRVV